MPNVHPGPVAKPKALTKKVQKAIIEYMENGSRLKQAALAAGIDYETLNYWRKLHEMRDAKALCYANFFDALKGATSRAEQKSLAVLNVGETNWQARAWLLERRFPERWASWKDRPVSADPVSRRAVIEEAARLAAERRAGLPVVPAPAPDDDAVPGDDVPGDDADAVPGPTAAGPEALDDEA